MVLRVGLFLVFAGLRMRASNCARQKSTRYRRDCLNLFKRTRNEVKTSLSIVRSQH
jgi:hypothetical protein